MKDTTVLFATGAKNMPLILYCFDSCYPSLCPHKMSENRVRCYAMMPCLEIQCHAPFFHPCRPAKTRRHPLHTTQHLQRDLSLSEKFKHVYQSTRTATIMPINSVTREECFQLNEILKDKSLPACISASTNSKPPSWWKFWQKKPQPQSTLSDKDPITTVTDKDCARLLGLLTEEMKNVDYADKNLPAACRKYIGKTEVL